MGASHSSDTTPVSSVPETYAKLTRQSQQQFDSLELQTIQNVFKQLATPITGDSIWTEDTFVKFLELPDEINSLLFLSASYVASWPFTHESPAILTFDALLRTIAIMLGRIDGIMPPEARRLLLYESFAVYDNRNEKGEEPEEKHVDDGIASLDEIEGALSDSPRKHTSTLRIRKTELYKLLKFNLTIQEKMPMEVVSHYIERFSGGEASEFARVATTIVQSISKDDKISFEELSRFLQTSPGLFATLPSLYSHFLFPNKAGVNLVSAASRSLKTSGVLNNAMAAQLSLFLPRELIYGKLDDLYCASRDGFSMGSFEAKVLRYPGPTVLVLIGETDEKVQTRYGLFSSVPWKQSSKDTFGDHDTVLFELQPRHKIHRSAELRHKTWFAKSIGLGIGCLPPPPGKRTADYGDLSLVIDTSLEYATFRDESRLRSTIKVAIQDVEVWGLGGDKEAQRKAWEWEEAEANRRRTINVKDIQADYDLLEMAGLVGQNRSGGSI